MAVEYLKVEQNFLNSSIYQNHWSPYFKKNRLLGQYSEFLINPVAGPRIFQILFFSFFYQLSAPSHTSPGGSRWNMRGSYLPLFCPLLTKYQSNGKIDSMKNVSTCFVNCYFYYIL